MQADSHAEIARLRGALRDLVALFSIPAAWVDREPAAVVEGLADTLAGLSQIEFVFVRLLDAAGAGVVDATRGHAWLGFTEWLERHAEASSRGERREIVPDVGGHEHPCRGLVIPIGVGTDGGLAAVASSRTDFPSEVDLLLLSLAVNHAATAFQNACLIHERKRVEAEVRRARDELAREQAALREIATLVACESSPQQLFAIVAEQVARIINVPLVRLLRYEQDGSRAELIGGWGESIDPLAIGTSWRLEDTAVLASVWHSGRPARVDDYSDLDRQAAAVVRQAGMRSVVASPISVEGRLWGAIAVLSPEQEPLPGDTEVRLADFTELIAAAVANAEARRELERFADEQQALRRAAVLVASGASPGEVFAAITTSASELFGVPFASLMRFGADETATMVAGCAACSGFVGQTWTVPADDPGIVRTVVKSRQPARIEDHSGVHGPLGKAASSLGIGSVVGAPVIVDGSVWGVLAVGAARDGPPLPASADGRLVGFAELVTMALINTEARDEVRRLLSEQESLRRVATLIAEGASPDSVFAAVCDEAVELFEAEQAAVVRLEVDEPVLVTVGLSAGVDGVAIGMRSQLGEWPTSSAACRTGRTARTDTTADETIGTGTIAEMIRAKGFLSSIAAPIVVDGHVWGAMTVSDSKAPLARDAERRIEGFTELISTAIANRDARDALALSEARARELANEQAALRRVAMLAARESWPVEVLEAVADEAARVLEVDAIGMIRFEPDETATLVAQSETPWEPPPLGTRFTLDGENVVTSLYRTGKVARLDDWETATGSVAALATVLGVRSAVACPIVVEGRLWGTMVAATNRGLPLPADTESRLVQFAELLATAISNAENREALTRRSAALAASEARKSAILESALDSVITIDHEGNVLEFNPAAEATFGYRREDVLGKQMAELVIPPSFRKQHHRGLERYLRTGEGPILRRRIELRGLRSDGSEFPVELAITPISVSGPPMFTAYMRDITAQKHGEEERVRLLRGERAARAEAEAASTRAHHLAREQAALRRVATLVAEGADVKEVYSAVAREVGWALGVRSVTVERYESHGGSVSFVVLASFEDPAFPVGSCWPLDGPSLRMSMYTTCQASRMHDWSGLAGTVAAAARREGMREAVGAPILVSGAVFGTICAGTSGDEPLSDGAEELLARFAELVSISVTNTTMRTELAASEAGARELANEQTALRRVATLVAQGASSDELFSAVAQEVAGIIDIPVVGVNRYEADDTFTMLGIAGETDFEVGSRWPVDQEGVAGMVRATGRPARRDDYSTMPGSLGEAMRGDLMVSTLGVPIVVEGRIWGFMVAAAKPGRPIPADTEARLARFTELVATAVSNASTRADLLRSRARLVTMADETRRRLERDLHDGIQQWLVALALKARKAAHLFAAGESPMQELSGLAEDLVTVTDELREISRGIHPAILSDAGLDDALKALARRSPIQIDLDVSFQGRFDPTLEATVYYVVAESITNAVKHAQASTVAVRGGRCGEVIALEIKDDGVGGADPRRGTGLIGLRDRVDTLGGTISFASSAGAGTTIRMRLPASPESGEHPPLEPAHVPTSAANSG